MVEVCHHLVATILADMSAIDAQAGLFKKAFPELTGLKDPHTAEAFHSAAHLQI